MPGYSLPRKRRAGLRIKSLQKKPEPKTERVTFLMTIVEHLDSATPEAISP